MALRPIKQEKNLLKRDIKAMEEGTLGMSQAEQDQISSKAQRDAQLAVQQTVGKQAAQLGLSGQGRTGQAAAERREMAGAAAEAAAKARAETAAYSRGLAEKRAEQTRRRIKEAADRRRAQPAKIAKTFKDVVDYGIKLGNTDLGKRVAGVVGEKLGLAKSGKGTSGETMVDSATKPSSTPGQFTAATEEEEELKGEQEADRITDEQKGDQGKEEDLLADEQEQRAREEQQKGPGGIVGKVISGASQGAQLGSLAGPKGAAVGGIIGGAGALVEGLAGKKAEQRRAARDGAEARPEAGSSTKPETDGLRGVPPEYFLEANPEQQEALAKSIGLTVDQAAELANEAVAKKRAVAGHAQTLGKQAS